VSVVGLLTALILVPLSGDYRLYSFLLASALAALLVIAVMAIRHRWPVLSSVATSIARLPGVKHWLEGKQSIIESAENTLFSFRRKAPKALWASVVLNVACHSIAVLEVYLLLYFMGATAGVPGALVIEGFTKLMNVVGSLNPGNFGTYEAGNVMVTRLLGIAGASGLTLALCRRARSLFWKLIGLLCLITMSRSTQHITACSRRRCEPSTVVRVGS
jgi:hypothetical protein